MYFQSLEQVLYMDGHGVYVWSCYGLFLLAIAWNLWRAGSQRRAQLHRLDQYRRRENH